MTIPNLPMIIHHKRTFLPVGHGAFFVERLFVGHERVLTAVYDCGDSKDGALVQHYAQQEFGLSEKFKEKIEILSISHFDTDHINGLKYIKPYLKATTRAFLPFYYTRLQSIYYANKRTGIEYVIRLLNQAQIHPTLVQYRDSLEPGQTIDIDDDKRDNKGSVIGSGQPIVKKYDGQPIWKYVPFNLFNE